MNVGENIKRIREIKRLTQESVAKSLGMSVTAYGNIERGDADLNFKKLAEIAEALEVDEKEIVNFDSDVYNQTVHNNDKGIGIVNKSQNSFYNGEKELYEKIIKDKDEEIAFLREQLRKG
jgi:transcriptional regulator with XRE-family HTH domain